MRLPIAALFLALVTVLIYTQSAGGLLYPAFDVISQYSFGLTQPLALAFHLFYHLGVKHFIGNVLPLFVFAFLLELSIPSLEVILLFLFSGMASALVFSLLNPASFLIGASSGVSALMTSSALLRPRLGVVFLLAVPLLTFGVVFPLIDQTVSSKFSAMEQEQTTLEKQAASLEQEKRFVEAQTVRVQAARVALELKGQKEGKHREEAAQTDFIVHLVGALFGAAFVFWRYSRQLEESLEDVTSFFERIRETLNI